MRHHRGQTPGVRVLLYCFKPPFPSGGGFAAASAGRGTSSHFMLADLARSDPRRWRRFKGASRPAVRRPANSIVKFLGWFGTQPSRVRSAGLRPPLTTASCGLSGGASFPHDWDGASTDAGLFRHLMSAYKRLGDETHDVFTRLNVPLFRSVVRRIRLITPNCFQKYLDHIQMPMGR